MGPEHPIDFISIGVVAEDGREYYAVHADMPLDKIAEHKWLMKNVMPQLPPQETWKPRAQIAEELTDFLLADNKVPSLHAWFSSYDHVVLAQIYGTMMNFPTHIPMYTHDVRSYVDWVGINPAFLPKQKTGNHDALEDARHLKKVYNVIEQYRLNKIETKNTGW